MAKRKNNNILELPGNPRGIDDHADSILGQGLRTFGDISGIVEDEETGWAVSGNQRCRHLDVNNPEKCRKEVLKKFDKPDKTGTVSIGLIWEKQSDGSEIPFNWRVVRWTKDQIRTAALLANKAGGFFILDDVATFGTDKNILDAGWTPEELNVMRAGGKDDPADDASRTEASETPEKGSVKRIAKLGTMIELVNFTTGLTHRLICGDSEEASIVGEVLDGDIPILCATDPPYGVRYDPTWRKIKGNINAKGKVKNDHKSDWTEALRLFPGQVLYLWSSSKYIPVSLDMIHKIGFDYLYEIIWKKSNFALGQGDYHYHHEPCFYAVRKGKKHNWQGSRKESTIWEIASNNAWGGSTDPNDAPTGHGTQKPLECFARPIRNNTARGQIVYDPFSGSGTTLVAADQLGRNFRGVELDPEWADVSVVRWLNYVTSEGQEVEIKINGRRSQKYKPTLEKAS